MTFGRTLKELTAICSIKRCNLAAGLGYDPSYVSRWINEVKLPSVSHDAELLGSIADYIAANATPEQRQRVLLRFDMDASCGADRAAFSRSLAELLAEAYEHSRGSAEPQTRKTGRENATLTRAKDAPTFPESIFETLRRVSETGDEVVFVSTMPIHAQFKTNEDFFRRIRATVGPDTPVKVLQFVDLDEMSSRPDVSCRSFCYLMSSPAGVPYDFYDIRNRRRVDPIFFIRDGLILQHLREPLSGELFLLESGDRELLSRYWSAAQSYTRNRPSMTAQPAQSDAQYFLEYFMQPHCRCLIKQMQPLFFPEALQRKLLAHEQDLGRQMGLFLDGAGFFESVLLYQPAFVDYIFSGKLTAFGRQVVIPREDRLQHLQWMLRRMEENPQQLRILSGQNHICGYDDLADSIFTSRSAAFALRHDDRGDRVRYTVTASGMIRHLNTWLDHLEALPPEECLSGKDAADYISRCIKLL